MNSNYSSIEKLGARILSHLPFAKNIAKNLYSKLVYWHYKKHYTHRAVATLKNVSSDNEGETFFGYYDKPPVNISGSHVIYQCSVNPTKFKPNCANPVNVVLQEVDSERVIAQLSSYAYNWQQGTRLQWLTDRRFIFNDYNLELDCYIAKVFDIDEDRVIKTFLMPIYDCFGEFFALTLNFDRLARLAPDYGYKNRLNKPINLDIVDSDGIFFIDMQNEESKLIITLKQLIEVEPTNSMQGALHTVNHVMIAPDGNNFIFIHRWYKRKQRFDRLMCAKNDGNVLKVLAAFGMVSHCFWIDESVILGYMRGPDGRDTYWLINAETGKMMPFTQSGIDKYGDGHPHVRGDWFVTDTYPDKARMQHLLLCNWKTGEFRELGEFFHGFDYNGETRCDLHPRFSPDGKEIFFDSVFDGSRRLYKLEVQL